MSHSRRQFTLRRLFLWVTVVACILGIFGGFRSLVRVATYAAVRTSYGGQRMTREEARAIRPDDNRIDWLPDSEFRPSPPIDRWTK